MASIRISVSGCALILELGFIKEENVAHFPSPQHTVGHTQQSLTGTELDAVFPLTPSVLRSCPHLSCNVRPSELPSL